MYGIQEELKEILEENGAKLVGFADLEPVWGGGMKTGVSVAVPLPRALVRSIQDGPNMEYYDAYNASSQVLDIIVTAGAEFLNAKGYRAVAQTTEAVVESDDYRTALPHKTVATRSGLGWIGKCALLVTPRYGSAVRLSSLLTNAPMQYGTPVRESRCGSCMACANACPGKAVSGKLWSAGADRNSFFDPHACRKAARALAWEKIEEEITLCGQCIVACPYTTRYLQEEELVPVRRGEERRDAEG